MSPAASVVSFVDFVFHHALTRPEKPAIILADRVVTYGMMAQGILNVEERIRALALPPGALVCVSLSSPVRHMIVGAALFRLGHPVIAAGRPSDVMPMRLPVDAYLYEAGTAFMPGQRQAVVDDTWFSGEQKPVTAGTAQGFTDERTICCVALSSGTTGRPKAISLTVKAFQQWVMNYYSTLGSVNWDRLLLLIGLNSSWGYTIAAHALFSGRTVLFAAAARDSLQMTAVYGVDAIAATSQQLREIVREQARAPVPCSSLRSVLTGGGLLSRSMMAEARARVCSTIVNLYGSTEAGGTAFATADQLTEADGATGFVAPWAEVQVVDEHGRMLGADTDGILRIRSTCQGVPYPPERASENTSFRGGWFYPGDRGRITAGGLMILNGRTSDVINVGGLKLAPEVIEDMLRQHPAIVDVAAFGGMGEGGIEEISVAIVVSRPVADAHLIDWCAERGVPLARIVTVDSLPKTDSGKVHRERIRQQYAQ